MTELADYEADLVQAVRNAVANGAEILDTIRPDWRDSVDLSTLELSSPRRCMLGQIYGEYGTGMDLVRQHLTNNGRNAWDNPPSYLGFDTGYVQVNGRDLYAGDEIFRMVWAEVVNNPGGNTIRVQLIAAMERVVRNHEKNAQSAQKHYDTLVSGYDDLRAEWEKTLSTAKERAEAAKAVASDARVEFETLTGE